MFDIMVANESDYKDLKLFYSTYYPVGHPLYNEVFWHWMYSNHSYGSCLLAKNVDGQIIGHLGCLHGGGRIWLVNILIDKLFSGKGLNTQLFDAARQLGPLTVALANTAGEGLLQKKKWVKERNLKRVVWINPFYSSILYTNGFFTKMAMQLDMPKPEGHFWQQPFLQGILLPDGSTGVIASNTFGLRLVEVKNISEVVEWALANDFRWIDWVGSPHDTLVPELLQSGFATVESFPWFLDPPDLNRNIELNLFAEEKLPEDFLFKRTYADMLRVGKIEIT